MTLRAGVLPIYDQPAPRSKVVPRSKVAQLAAFFIERPGVWVDGRLLGQIAGAYGWRTRASELRHAPWHMTIENRVRKAESVNGIYAVSEYRYVPGKDERP